LCEEELAEFEDEISDLSRYLQRIEDEYDDIQDDMEDLESNYSYLESRYSSLLERNIATHVTYEEVQQFIEEDNTSQGTESEFDYICKDFSDDMINSAYNEGIFACEVGLWVQEDGQGDPVPGEVKGHSLVAFNTSDKGVVFVEPQKDIFIHELSKGDDYCELVGWNCQWRIEYIKHCFL